MALRTNVLLLPNGYRVMFIVYGDDPPPVAAGYRRVAYGAYWVVDEEMWVDNTTKSRELANAVSS